MGSSQGIWVLTGKNTAVLKSDQGPSRMGEAAKSQERPGEKGGVTRRRTPGRRGGASGHVAGPAWAQRRGEAHAGGEDCARLSRDSPCRSGRGLERPKQALGTKEGAAVMPRWRRPGCGEGQRASKEGWALPDTADDRQALTEPRPLSEAPNTMYPLINSINWGDLNTRLAFNAFITTSTAPGIQSSHSQSAEKPGPSHSPISRHQRTAPR